jgi:signal transduction histidine kinase
MAEQRAALEESVRAARAGGPQTGSAFDLERGVVATRALRQLSARMSAEEGAKLAQREADRAASIRNLTIVTLVGGLLLIVVGIGSIWVILGFTRDLSRSRDELRRMNAGLEGAVRERTSDLQRANDEIQRFAYIVSHDLRSPLVNVMGFTAELEAAIRPLGDLLERAKAEAPGIVTPDARAAVETDLPEAVNFIRTSTQKMDRLINAILQLSRQGRRVLAPEPLAMSRLLAGVVDNLKHRTEELGAQIVIEPGVPGLISDRLAVEQIFSNLVENALKYLSPARPGRIVLRGRHEGARVIYEVVDNGRGVDPKDHERIFDLFRRAGHQDQPGEGIGLAHVRALAYRLGGTVGMQSALDQGATFRVSLPAAMSVEGVA